MMHVQHRAAWIVSSVVFRDPFGEPFLCVICSPGSKQSFAAVVIKIFDDVFEMSDLFVSLHSAHCKYLV
jgi:hypothetical protein